jgi:hypothetical protein
MLPTFGQEIFSFRFRGLEITMSRCVGLEFKSQALPPMKPLTQGLCRTSEQRLGLTFERALPVLSTIANNVITLASLN